MPDHVHGIIWLVDTDKSIGEVGAMDDECVGAGLDRGNFMDVKPARTGEAISSVSIIAGGKRMVDGVKNEYPLSEIIRGFKTFSVRRINELRGMAGVPVWQRNYYEHIVRDDGELQRIRVYIVNIYEREVRELQSNGLIQELSKGLYQWEGMHDEIKGIGNFTFDPCDFIVYTREEYDEL